ncbi:MAG: 4Fe-4S binding protein [Synergistaceae bacterium]|nr:4Fe-4S binding protein [Synergistaceae bacterium]
MKWRNWLWLWPVVYFALGMFNILFAWLGMIDFMLPLLFAIFGGNKNFCNYYCGRGMLFSFLPKKFKCSSGKLAPRWLSSQWFRYVFLVFFMGMFANVCWQSWLVFGGVASVSEAVRLLWVFRVPWGWAYTAGNVPGWVAQFSFGLYGLMLTSAIIGLAVMALYRPRTWCTFCPMGTMTQAICKLKATKTKKIPLP